MNEQERLARAQQAVEQAGRLFGLTGSVEPAHWEGDTPEESVDGFWVRYAELRLTLSYEWDDELVQDPQALYRNLCGVLLDYRKPIVPKAEDS